MANEKKSIEVRDIVDKEPALETPRKVSRVSKVALIVFPVTLITIAILILVYYLIFDK